MTQAPNLFAPECAGASVRWHEKCPRCGAGRQDNCADDLAFYAQLVKRGSRLAPLHKLYPIAIAPTDGTWIIGWAASDSSPYRISWGRNHHGELAWCSAVGSFVPGYITHWMPMPEVNSDT